MKNNILEIGNFVYYNDPSLQKRMPRWKILSLFDQYPNNIMTIKGENGFDGAAFYLRLTDQTLHKILLGDFDFQDEKNIYNALKENGQNIHFLKLVGGKVKIIRDGMKEVIKKENPLTISWVRKNKIFLYDIKYGGVYGRFFL